MKKFQDLSIGDILYRLRKVCSKGVERSIIDTLLIIDISLSFRGTTVKITFTDLEDDKTIKGSIEVSQADFWFESKPEEEWYSPNTERIISMIRPDMDDITR
jgi:hypothetical protein